MKEIATKKLQEPVDMIVPMTGRITSPYGPRVHPVTGVKGRFHNGVDIAGPIGRDVISPADGVVSDIYFHEFGGKTMIIDHDNGYQSRMCHLDDYNADKGDRVIQGDIVAKCGNTGRSTGPHLHYGLKKAGKFVDPQTVINFNH